eukprot:scaffold172119_cov16-Tisochrysis_lutea.AAC.1
MIVNETQISCWFVAFPCSTRECYKDEITALNQLVSAPEDYVPIGLQCTTLLPYRDPSWNTVTKLHSDALAAF